ncbi:hypothetical protein KKG41_01640 [Patescibacteria group bacterium]|nr:hypothetical protein [Patescibacteria group bacterium]MBU1890479.1 hypothetical protein [Patescibacteria group bacterium]
MFIILEILAIDKGSEAMPHFTGPEININNTILPFTIWLIMALIFFLLARLFYYIFKLIVAGTDEEDLESAKSQIKISVVFIIVSSISWVLLSALHNGLITIF